MTTKAKADRNYTTFWRIDYIPIAGEGFAMTTETKRDVRKDDVKIAQLLGWKKVYESFHWVWVSPSGRCSMIPLNFHTWRYGHLCLEYAQREWRDKDDGCESWEVFQEKLWALRHSRLVEAEAHEGDPYETQPITNLMGYEAADDYAIAILAASEKGK